MKLKNLLFLLTISFNCMSCQVYDPGFDYRNFDGTPVEKLARAVQNDDIMLINRLVKEEKLDLNYQEKKFRNTVFNLAVINQNKATIEVLLKLGANPNFKRSPNGRSAFLDLLEYTFPARTCDISKIQLLINYGANVNSEWVDEKQNIKRTALSIACSHDCIDAVKLLVENGADINKYTYYEGYGAITEALIQDNIEIAKYLIVDKKATVPKYVYERFYGNAPNDPPTEYLTITDMLMEKDYTKEPSKQKAKKEILSYLRKIGKK